MAGDFGGDFEALVVIGALLVEDAIFGRVAKLALGHLLEHRFVIAVTAVGGVLNFRVQVFEDEFFGRLQSAVEIDGRDQRFEHVGQQVLGNLVMPVHPLAQKRKSPRRSFLLIFARNVAG